MRNKQAALGFIFITLLIDVTGFSIIIPVMPKLIGELTHKNLSDVSLYGGLLGHFGLRVPFFASAALALLNWLYGYFVLPESLPKEKRRKFEWKRANPLGSLKQLKKYPQVSGLVLSITLLYIAVWAVQSC